MVNCIEAVNDHVLADTLSETSTTLRNTLRAQTNAVHQQLHLHPSFVALFNGSIDLHDYTMLMQRFHGYYTALDNAIERAFDLPAAQFTYPTRGDLLARDLIDLGMSRAQVDANPQCTDLYDAVTPASLGGVLYVIEGATLGAAQIDRAAQKTLSSDTTKGRSFWAWSRAHGKVRWAAINQLLSELEASGQPHTPMVKGAHDTFQALADWLAPLESTQQ